MTNQSSASAERTPSGYLGLYSPCWSTAARPVTDAKGKLRLFPTEEQAKLAAYETLVALENRISALRLDPAQKQEVPKPWEITTARSQAGKRLQAEALFKREQGA